MLDFFTDCPILPTSMGKLAPRTIELNEVELYNEIYSHGSTICDVMWEMPDYGCEAPEEYVSSEVDKEKRRRPYELRREIAE